MCGSFQLNFSVSKKFEPRVRAITERWKNDESAASMSNEICAAILERDNAQNLAGFVMPRLDEPTIDLAKLYTQGKISTDKALEILDTLDDYDEIRKRLRKAVAVHSAAESERERKKVKPATN